MLPCDVTDEASVAALVATVLSQTGRIDVLVNNAGVGLFGGRVARQTSLLRRIVPAAMFDKALRQQFRLPA